MIPESDEVRDFYARDMTLRARWFGVALVFGALIWAGIIWAAIRWL